MTRERYGTPSKPALAFPKTFRILKRSDFLRAYAQGKRFPGPYFTAFCLERSAAGPARAGFSTSKAIGDAVERNRARRRIREVVRLSLARLPSNWEVVFNVRKAAVTAPFAELSREVDRVFAQCGNR